MERKKELDIVYLIASPIENSEGNLAASYSLQNKDFTSEDQVIVLDDDYSVVANTENSIIDKDENSTITNSKNTDVANESIIVEILEKNYCEGRTEPHDRQVTEADRNKKLESCASNERYVDVSNIVVETEYHGNSKRNGHSFENPKALSILRTVSTSVLNQDGLKGSEQPVQKQRKTVCILKPIDTFSPNQGTASVRPRENSVACNNINMFDDCEEMEVNTLAENESSFSSKGVEVEEVTCKYCLKMYSCKSDRYRHLRNFHKIDFKRTSNEKEHNENQLGAVSILKPLDTSSSNQDTNSVMPCENSVTSSNVNVPNDCEEMEIDAQAENEPCMISDGIELDDLTCPFCLKKYSCKTYKNRHVRVYHKIVKSQIERHIRCMECDIIFNYMQKLREHLQMAHMMNMEREEVFLPNMNAFYKWKQEVERRDVASFRIKRKEIISDQERKYYFICQQSGKYEAQLSGPRKRMLMATGAYRLGALCTACIFCEERANEVYVKYYPHHYGHGDKVPSVKPSSEEQNAAPENESNDIPFESLLDDIRESTSQDYHTMNLRKKKEMKFIRKTVNSEEYISGLSDAESVDRWVRLCCQMEDSPILYYTREEEEFTLMIMTEFQKHILLSSDKQVVSVDSLGRRICKGVYFHLTYIHVMDECEVAFPVAFCISNKMDKKLFQQFLMCIRESTGPLSCTYFVSDWKKYYYEAWVEIMDDKSKWIWSFWYIDYRHSYQIREAFTKDVSPSTFKGNFLKRAEAYKKFRMMLECQNPNLFESMFKGYVEWLQDNQPSKKLGNKFLQKYSTNKEMWANCYQKDLKLSTVISMELLHRTVRFCCIEGRKIQRLDKFILVIMKLVRYKMLARLMNMLDTEKLGLVIDAIDDCHRIGLDISTDRISSISNKIWLIRSDAEEEDAYITCEFDLCPELCSLRCSECDICVHMFSCSCMQNMIHANLCPHVHAIVFKFLRPHFSPMNSPARDDIEDFDNVDVIPSLTPSELLLESALKKTHDVYTKIRSNKYTLSQESLTSVIQRLNDCLDICSGKKVNENKSTNTESLPPDKEPLFTSTNPFAIKTSSQLSFTNRLPQSQPHSRYFFVVQNNNN